MSANENGNSIGKVAFITAQIWRGRETALTFAREGADVNRVTSKRHA